jgi:hydroxymethylglutaryl-CoA reductase
MKTGNEPSEEELPSARRVSASKHSGVMGNGKSKRFAEIIAATAMAGEISHMISIVNGTNIYAHETFGRNRPPQ